MARAWASPGLLIFPVIGLAAMLVGFAVAPKEPSGPSEAGPYDGQILSLSEEEFDRLEDEVERSARDPLPPPEPMDDAAKDAFAQLVRDAIDELPDFVQQDLSEGNLAITLRHEVAHFYGADEQKVRELGL